MGEGFRVFFDEMNRRHSIPSRRTTINRIVKLYDATQKNVKTLLNDQHVTLQLHIIFWGDCELKHHVLQVGGLRVILPNMWCYGHTVGL